MATDTGAPTRGRARYEAETPLPAAATADMERWGARLAKWNSRINLVAPGTLDDFWVRHALDSAQIVPLIAEDARTLADFGSGAGFPGLAVAIDAKHRGLPRHVHLIESAGKKASFLRTVIRELELPATVHRERIEAVPPLQADTITARAFAPLTRMVPLARRHLHPGGQLVLLKGERLDDELRAMEAANDVPIVVVRRRSLSDESGVIVSLALPRE